MREPRMESLEKYILELESKCEAADKLYKTSASFAEEIQEDCECLNKIAYENFIEGLSVYEQSRKEA